MPYFIRPEIKQMNGIYFSEIRDNNGLNKCYGNSYIITL